MLRYLLLGAGKESKVSYQDGNKKDGKHYWLTPPEIYEKLDQEFHFDFDPCPYPRPEGFDGLEVNWGKSNYVNPPFNSPTKWVRKAIEEYRKGNKIIVVIPIDKWIHYFLREKAEIRNFGDIKWLAIEDNMPGPGVGKWVATFVLDPEINPPVLPEGQRLLWDY